MLEKELREAKAELDELRAVDFKTKEAELETAIEEADDDEQRSAVESAIAEFEEEQNKTAEGIAKLTERISAIESKIAELDADAVPEERDDENKDEEKVVERKEIKHMEKRAFDRAPIETRERIMHDEEVRTFVEKLQTMDKRSLSDGGLTVPVVMLDLIKENVYNYSKLINRVRVRTLNGEGRQVVAGTVPEAVWTECCASVTEIDWGFTRVTLDCYKVAGYIPVCNGVLTDSAYDLVAEIIEMLGQAIGKALDKAILLGSGTGEPLGIATRLAQTAEPADYDPKAPAWVDLHTSNVVDVTKGAGAQFFAELLGAISATANPYARGEMFFAMNSKTYYAIMASAIAVNANGAFVAQNDGRMPVIGGDIDVLEFVPDDTIIGGYGDLYILGERQGITVEQSEHVQFIEDNTVFKGKARYDGKPVIASGFVVVNLVDGE